MLESCHSLCQDDESRADEVASVDVVICSCWSFVDLFVCIIYCNISVGSVFFCGQNDVHIAAFPPVPSIQ